VRINRRACERSLIRESLAKALLGNPPAGAVSCYDLARDLAAKGYRYQFVFSRNVGHTDAATKRQTLPEALEYIWQGYTPR